MPDNDDISDLGPLPQADRNSELQRSSIKALNALLRGQDALLFRDERVEDYGVDGALELIIQGGATNFRGQVQLKATESVGPNRDGSISLSVRTANLNYLLNGTSPIYLLFDADQERFWYVWAHDENRRLTAINPEWRTQEEITLRFTERLVPDAFPQIVGRVRGEGQMHRRVHDALARATASEQVVISINPESLAIQDPGQAQHILLASGPALVAAGFPKEALNMLALVDFAIRGLPRLQLTAGYAEYMLGNHFNALGHIRQALARAQELSERDRTFLASLKDIVRADLPDSVYAGC